MGEQGDARGVQSASNLNSLSPICTRQSQAFSRSNTIVVLVLSETVLVIVIAESQKGTLESQKGTLYFIS